MQVLGNQANKFFVREFRILHRFCSRSRIARKMGTHADTRRHMEVDLLRIHVLGREYDALRSGERFFAEGKVRFRDQVAEDLKN